MSDRVAGFFVVLDQDVEGDVAEGIKTALMHIKHVESLESYIANPAISIARVRIRNEIFQKIFKLLDEV